MNLSFSKSLKINFTFWLSDGIDIGTVSCEYKDNIVVSAVLYPDRSDGVMTVWCPPVSGVRYIAVQTWPLLDTLVWLRSQVIIWVVDGVNTLTRVDTTIHQ